ncbi:NfeD family protein [Castellaniella sp. MT123]|uniref:NfeD family protein n=1 Tax=Castellaniella sp. MT123 TaxID=3140381 RepID=UPI0031F40605
MRTIARRNCRARATEGEGMLLVYFSSQSVWALGLLGLVILLAVVIAVQAHRSRAQGGNEELPGMTGEVTEPSDARGRAWALVRGEVWQVRADVPLHPGQGVRVLRARGLILLVEPIPERDDSLGESS